MKPINLNELLFGGGSTTLLAGATPTENFLHVVDNGLDWNGPSGARSAYDFAQGLDFQQVLSEHPDLPNRFLSYTTNHVLAVADQEPEYQGDLGYDDSVADALYVWDRIAAAAVALGTPWSLDGSMLKVADFHARQLHDQCLSAETETGDGAAREAMEGLLARLAAYATGPAFP